MNNNVLFVTGCFPKDKQQYYLDNSKNYYSLASDVLSWRIIEGLDQCNISFSVMSCPFVPTFPKDYKVPWLRSYKWSHSGMENNDLVIGCINIKYIAIFNKSTRLRKNIIKWIDSSNRNRHILFYSNDISFMRIVRQLKEHQPDLKITVLITDLNEFDNDRVEAKNIKEKIKQMKFDYRMNSVYSNMAYVDNFVLLADKMKDYINLNNRNYMVCEGICNADIPYCELVEHSEKFRLVYSGNLHRRYGILKVAQAVGELSHPFELIVCGDGDAKDELIELTRKYSNIVYLGMLSNEKVIKLQQSADLLVNSMPNFGRHTELSFPSKLMEYMVQGRPVMCFKVPGIPDEYDAYLKYFYDETIEGIKNSIEDIYELPFDARKKLPKIIERLLLRKKIRNIKLNGLSILC